MTLGLSLVQLGGCRLHLNEMGEGGGGTSVCGGVGNRGF